MNEEENRLSSQDNQIRSTQQRATDSKKGRDQSDRKGRHGCRRGSVDEVTTNTSQEITDEAHTRVEIQREGNDIKARREEGIDGIKTAPRSVNRETPCV